MEQFADIFGVEDPGMMYAVALFGFIFLLFLFYGLRLGSQNLKKQNLNKKSDQLLRLIRSLRPPEVDPDTPLPSVAQIKAGQWFANWGPFIAFLAGVGTLMVYGIFFGGEYQRSGGQSIIARNGQLIAVLVGGVGVWLLLKVSNIGTGRIHKQLGALNLFETKTPSVWLQGIFHGRAYVGSDITIRLEGTRFGRNVCLEMTAGGEGAAAGRTFRTVIATHSQHTFTCERQNEKWLLSDCPGEIQDILHKASFYGKGRICCENGVLWLDHEVGIDEIGAGYIDFLLHHLEDLKFMEWLARKLEQVSYVKTAS